MLVFVKATNYVPCRLGYLDDVSCGPVPKNGESGIPETPTTIQLESGGLGDRPQAIDIRLERQKPATMG